MSRLPKIQASSEFEWPGQRALDKTLRGTLLLLIALEGWQHGLTLKAYGPLRTLEKRTVYNEITMKSSLRQKLMYDRYYSYGTAQGPILFQSNKIK